MIVSGRSSRCIPCLEFADSGCGLQDNTSYRRLDTNASFNISATLWENQQCGFRPGPTQTDLYKHRKELEA